MSTQERAAQAGALFDRGYNCAQSVACAFADLTGLPEENLAKMASSFGGGIGRLRETCGAVSGMALVLGMLAGYSDPGDSAAKSAHYARVQRAVRAFAAENGSLICRELLGLDQPEGSPVASPRTETYYKKRPCVEMVGLAADLLEQYLAEHPVPQREANA